MTTHYIALDVHCAFTEMAVVSESGRLTQRWRGGTTIPELVQAISLGPPALRDPHVPRGLTALRATPTSLRWLKHS